MRALVLFKNEMQKNVGSVNILSGKNHEWIIGIRKIASFVVVSKYKKNYKTHKKIIKSFVIVSYNNF